jgi:hypothetical protein
VRFGCEQYKEETPVPKYVRLSVNKKKRERAFRGRKGAVGGQPLPPLLLLLTLWLPPLLLPLLKLPPPPLLLLLLLEPPPPLLEPLLLLLALAFPLYPAPPSSLAEKGSGWPRMGVRRVEA